MVELPIIRYFCISQENKFMKAIEFTNRVSRNSIKVPENFKKEMNLNKGKKARVILLFDDHDEQPEKDLQSFVEEEFLKGYETSDKIYDNY